MVEIIDECIQKALKQHHSWYMQACPSGEHLYQPRVMVTFGSKTVLRRPFMKAGHWRVRWNGTARLVEPHEQNGLIVFNANYGRP